MFTKFEESLHFFPLFFGVGNFRSNLKKHSVIYCVSFHSILNCNIVFFSMFLFGTGTTKNQIIVYTISCSGKENNLIWKVFIWSYTCGFLRDIALDSTKIPGFYLVSVFTTFSYWTSRPLIACSLPCDSLSMTVCCVWMVGHHCASAAPLEGAMPTFEHINLACRTLGFNSCRVQAFVSAQSTENQIRFTHPLIPSITVFTPLGSQLALAQKFVSHFISGFN